MIISLHEQLSYKLYNGFGKLSEGLIDSSTSEVDIDNDNQARTLNFWTKIKTY